MAETDSPCINVCRLDGNRICSGCWRHIDEIVAWRQLDDVGRNAVIARAEKRREQFAQCARIDQIGKCSPS